MTRLELDGGRMNWAALTATPNSGRLFTAQAGVTGPLTPYWKPVRPASLVLQGSGEPACISCESVPRAPKSQ